MRPANVTEDPSEKRAIRWAMTSLVTFCLLTSTALWAFFARSDAPWRWASVVATASTFASIAICVLVFRSPSRTTIGSGIGVMIFSLLRAGSPSSWTSASYALFAVTTLLIVPLVHAVIILPRRSS
jgi:hypothetical protein